jgi:hypothetical protein
MMRLETVYEEFNKKSHFRNNIKIMTVYIHCNFAEVKTTFIRLN